MFYKLNQLLEAKQLGKLEVGSLWWELPDRLDLFDSLYQGYPLGTIITVESSPGIFSVIDGSQRINSLVGAMTGDLPVFFNCDTKKFEGSSTPKQK